MTRYFIDSEFIDDGESIDLISIGIVSEDGRKYYAQSTEFNHKKASPWVKENVFPHLIQCPYVKSKYPGSDSDKITSCAVHLHKYGQCIPTMNEPERWRCPWRTREQIRDEVAAFLDPEQYGKPELWGYYSAYDHVAFCQLFGSMVDLPQGFPMLTYDLRQLLDMKGMHDVCQPDSIHNALEDAHWIARTHKDLVR